MSDNLRDQIYQNFDLKSTEELLEIWEANDRAVWSDMAFEVMNEILAQRLNEVPPQNEPVYEHEEPVIDRSLFRNMSLPPFTDPEYAPEFYRPKEVLWIDLWLNRLAIASVVAIVVASFSQLDTLHQIVHSYMAFKPAFNFVAWLIAIIVTAIGVSIDGFISYYVLRALASILRILMEMEFNSRGSE